MNNINITISAPELVEAMQALTAALAVGTVKPAQVETLVEKLEAQTDKPSKAKKEPKSEPKEELPATVATETNVTVTLEDVRGKLATLSQTGKAKEVKQLIASYGATKLTEIPTEQYAEVLAKAEEL